MKKIKKEAHKKLDKIFNNELFSSTKNNKLTLKEMSEELFRRKNELTSSILKGTLDYGVSLLEKSIRARCIKCKNVLTRHKQKTTTLKTINGEILFTRNYFYCRICKIGFCPADQELKIVPRRLQFDVQWKILELIVKFPYEEAVNELCKHYGVDINKKTLHELVNDVANGITIKDCIKTTDEIRTMLNSIRNNNKRRVVVVIGIDGTFVPIRPDHIGRKGKRGKGYWREAKGIRIYAVSKKRIYHILSWHQIQNADKLKNSLDTLLDLNYIPSDIARICVCADGADWIWNRVKELYPDAKLVLDYYHCSEYICEIAEKCFRNETEKIKWINEAKDSLFLGDVLKLVKRLREMNVESTEIQHETALLADYLEKRAEMTFYNSLKKGGYPIGSGGIESSNKYVCHRRMKLSGAWWKEEMANEILTLRSAFVNGTLNNVFNVYIEKQMKKHYIDEFYNEK